MRRKRLAAGVVSTLLGVAGCATATLSSLESVLERHTASRGGANRIEAIRAMRVKLNVEEPKFKVDIAYVADRAGRVRVDVLQEGKRVFSEGVDELGGWSMGEGGPPKAIAKEGTAALEHGRLFNLHGLHELIPLGHRIAFEGRKTVRGREYDVLRVEFSDGFQTWRFLDAENGRMELQQDHRAIHPDLDPTPVWTESRNSDFRTVEGVVFHFVSKQYALETEEWMQTTQVHSIELNPPLTDQELRRPAP